MIEFYFAGKREYWRTGKQYEILKKVLTKIQNLI